MTTRFKELDITEGLTGAIHDCMLCMNKEEISVLNVRDYVYQKHYHGVHEVNIYIYIYISVHAHTYPYIFSHTYTHTHPFTHIYSCTYSYIFMRATHIYTYSYTVSIIVVGKICALQKPFQSYLEEADQRLSLTFLQLSQVINYMTLSIRSILMD